MAQNLRANSMMIKRMAKEFLNGLMAVYMKEKLETIFFMEKGAILGRMGAHMKVILRMG